VALCRELDLLSDASVAIDGSKFKAVNARDKNFTEAKMKRGLERIEESIARYIAQLETADRRGDAMPEAKVERFNKDKIANDASWLVMGIHIRTCSFAEPVAVLRRRQAQMTHASPVPSPTTFGRWPFIRMSDEMKIFDTIRMRGAIRLGNFLIASNPARAMIAAVSIIENVLIRLGLYQRARIPPAPYAIAAELKRADQLYVSRNAPVVSEAVIFDYAFLTPTRPYILRPGARTAVLMHDLFSARADLFSASGVRDSTTVLDFATEKKLLCNADCIIAIQSAEADVLRSGGASGRIVVAPMAVAVVDEPQPGSADEILFVGSKAAPNVDGIAWFLSEVWPALRTRLPRSRLRVAGSVCSVLPPAPDGVEYLGLVNDLSDCYRTAAVIVSPLRVGSGLKIKLVEAMGQGKAVVATSVNLQGVETIVQDCVRRADTSDEFVREIEELSRDSGARAELGHRALTIARERFSDESCYSSLEAFFRKDPQ
jgi:succinoglycan biosynthesis protein ExoO